VPTAVRPAARATATFGVQPASPERRATCGACASHHARRGGMPLDSRSLSASRPPRVDAPSRTVRRRIAVPRARNSVLCDHWNEGTAPALATTDRGRPQHGSMLTSRHREGRSLSPRRSGGSTSSRPR
jgi:hypothetical protein